MILNYLKIAFRNLLKNRIYASVNILGLAVGLAVCMLIVLYVVHEYSYDRFHTYADRIYQAKALGKMGEMTLNFDRLSYGFGSALKSNATSVEDVVRVGSLSYGSLKVEADINHKFEEESEKVIFTENSFFKVFSFNVISGNPTKSLQEPFKAFLTPRAAKKYFGNKNPIGRTLKVDKDFVFEVVGLVDSLPTNTVFKYDFVCSLPSLPLMYKQKYKDNYTPEDPKSIGTGDYATYLLLRDAQKATSLEKTMPKLVNKKDDFNTQYSLQKLTDAHLIANSELKNMLAILGFVSLLILVLGLVNYMNLTTARATTRAKEVGVRKATGASVRGLMTQFYFESLLNTSLAFGVALVFFVLLRSVFLSYFDLTIDATFLFSPFFVGALAVIFMGCLVLSGSYPALLMSRFSPIQALRGHTPSRVGGAGIRQALTVFQFTVSAILIVGILVVYSQLRYMRTKDIGLNRDHTLVINLQGKMKNQTLRQAVEALPETQKTTFSQMPLYRGGIMIYNAKIPNSDKQLALLSFPVEQSFFEVLGIQILQKASVPSDVKSVVLNEEAAKALKITDKQLGQEFDFGNDFKSHIAGIVKNFNFFTLKNRIEPMIYDLPASNTPFDWGHLYIKVTPNTDLPKTIANIERIYNQYKIEKPFSYYFLDDAFNELYKSEERMERMLLIFTLLAIFISCLGLLGLATFTAEQRTKEIGIRKVLGASVASVVTLLSKDFLKLVMVAIVIATPIAYYCMDKWLQDFAYRIEISWWIFALAGALAIVIAFLTVGYQAIKAALMNPIKSLKTE